LITTADSPAYQHSLKISITAVDFTFGAVLNVQAQTVRHWSKKVKDRKVVDAVNVLSG